MYSRLLPAGYGSDSELMRGLDSGTTFSGHKERTVLVTTNKSSE